MFALAQQLADDRVSAHRAIWNLLVMRLLIAGAVALYARTG
jgi:hypothetical protein